MEQTIERRGAGPAQQALQEEVRKALALQRHIGTVAAVEHLKSAGAESALITRVLCGQDVREADRRLAPSVVPEPRRRRNLRQLADGGLA